MAWTPWRNIDVVYRLSRRRADEQADRLAGSRVLPPSPSNLLHALKWLWGHLTGIDAATIASEERGWPTGQAGYRFEGFSVVSPDGSRRWRVDLGVPCAPPPLAGLPSLWMLDGWRALAEFDRALLQALAARPQPPLLVFLSHDDEAAPQSARVRDYTFRAGHYPFLCPPGAPPQDGVGGGADALLELMERQIWPRLQARMVLDPRRRTLWGHSLAGLFVVYALLARPCGFRTHIAGSPSLWWCKGALLGEPFDRFAQRNAGRRVRVLLSLGADERAGRAPPPAAGDFHAVALREAGAETAPDAAFQLACRLADVPGVEVGFQEFTGLDHAGMFRASLLQALHDVAGIDAQAARAGSGAG